MKKIINISLTFIDHDYASFRPNEFVSWLVNNENEEFKGEIKVDKTAYHLDFIINKDFVDGNENVKKLQERVVDFIYINYADCTFDKFFLIRNMENNQNTYQSSMIDNEGNFHFELNAPKPIIEEQIEEAK